MRALTTSEQLRIISEKPNTSDIEWQTIAIYGAIALVGVAAFAYIIVSNQNTMQQQWQLAVNETNRNFLETLKIQNDKLFSLTYEVRQANDFFYNLKSNPNDTKSRQGSQSTDGDLEK